MIVHTLNPLTDRRWGSFLDRHPDASIFHTKEWLEALYLTYGYEPIAFTTSDGDELSNALVFCEIRSWLTGKRLVSLPFSDHCQPLAYGRDLELIVEHLHSRRGTQRLKYIEIRPLESRRMTDARTNFKKSEIFSFQTIDLLPETDQIYKGFHDSCIRRKIKKADRENLVYESGRSEELLQKFRQLLLLTRRRHKLPPQPASWFRNIAQCLGDMMTIHVLSKDDVPVASIVTLRYKQSLIYKYGCSDSQFNNLGATPLLFWKVIQQAKATGAEEFDLGRSGYDDPGLIAFKEHLGAVSSELSYYRSPAANVKTVVSKPAMSTWARHAITRLPDSLLTGVGQVLYRHIG